MNGPKKHVLIADCDEHVLIRLERLLQDEGFETTTVWSGRQMQQELQQRQFDLLLLADQPPEINCELILREGRKKGWGVPVIVLENRPRHPFAESYLRTLGAREIVQKWEPGKVRDAVHGIFSLAHMGAAKSAVAAAMKVG